MFLGYADKSYGERSVPTLSLSWSPPGLPRRGRSILHHRDRDGHAHESGFCVPQLHRAHQQRAPHWARAGTPSPQGTIEVYDPPPSTLFWSPGPLRNNNLVLRGADLECPIPAAITGNGSRLLLVLNPFLGPQGFASTGWAQPGIAFEQETGNQESWALC